jgi:hypothetical protein
MDLFDNVHSSQLQKKLKERLYPFFRPLSDNEGTEVFITVNV